MTEALAAFVAFQSWAEIYGAVSLWIGVAWIVLHAPHLVSETLSFPVEEVQSREWLGVPGAVSKLDGQMQAFGAFGLHVLCAALAVLWSGWVLVLSLSVDLWDTAQHGFSGTKDSEAKRAHTITAGFAYGLGFMMLGVYWIVSGGPYALDLVLLATFGLVVLGMNRIRLHHLPAVRRGRIARIAVAVLLALSLTGCTPALRNGLAKAADVILGPRIATETLTKAERLAAKAEKLATEAGLLEERAEEAADAPFRKCKAKRIGAAGADLSALALTLIESECRLLHPSVAVAPVERPETFAQCMARLCPVDCEASESLWGLAHQACLGKPEG